MLHTIGIQEIEAGGFSLTTYHPCPASTRTRTLTQQCSAPHVPNAIVVRLQARMYPHRLEEEI